MLRSLDPQCTPLKHRYDSCFNLWFEGYLQPALDGRPASAGPSSATPTVSLTSGKQVGSSGESSTVQAQPEERHSQLASRQLITNWSYAFRSRGDRRVLSPGRDEHMGEIETGHAATHEAASQAVRAIDRRGKTRAQIKAEEYEAGCGQLWRDYQGCLRVSSWTAYTQCRR